MTAVHPISRAWLSSGGTGAQNYDEFADEAEITKIIEANPRSALAIEMPHRVPGNVGRSYRDCLTDAAGRLAQAKNDGDYTAAEDVLVLYRISAPGGAPGDLPGTTADRGPASPDAGAFDGACGYGLFCMVDTDQISTSVDEPGLVIRNEDVFIEKVRERVALAEATGHLLSPVLLLRTARVADSVPSAGPGTVGLSGDGAPRSVPVSDPLHAALAEACAAAGAPAVTDVDQAGRTHAIWPVPPGPSQDRLRELATAGELVVADGNHRSLAAQIGGLPRFLAVITTPGSVSIQPYNRLITELTAAPDELIARLRDAGATVEPLAGRPGIPPTGVIHLSAGGRAWAVRLPRLPDAAMVDNLDHALVERVLLRDALGLDPGDKRITYVGGDYPADWLVGEVDAGRAELAVLIAPVSVADFITVNLARLKLPRKSTWFTPKARGGLVLAQL